jgi:hypothetical protein
MSEMDRQRSITAVRSVGATAVHIIWSDGTKADVDLLFLLRGKDYAALRDVRVFDQVRVGEWGHSLAWPNDIDIGADQLWRETLSATGHHDARQFLDWRLRHGLSLSKAADVLGLSRRMVAYYSNGEKPVPKSILLACKGWEVHESDMQAA